MKSILQQVNEGKILVSDGAWGTFLQKKGLKPGECPESWNIARSGDVFEIAKSYIDAGANMIETNSFGGSVFKLQAYGLGNNLYELNRAAAEISRKAAGPHKNVLGSIGPTGKMILMGDVSFDELYEAFKVQAIALADGGADTLIVETMTDIEEAIAAVKACKENTNCEIICTMTFDKTSEKAYHTIMGVSPDQMLGEIVSAGASIIGANCGNGMKDMIEITEIIRTANHHIPILIHANAGLPIFRDGQTFFPESPEEMAAYVDQLIKAGANIIGGCCGTTPEHIRLIARAVAQKS
jgi:5-methyltetrahydrofolate--homocysteine methyltransferase